MKEKAIVLWSGGKDSALALRESLASHEPAALVTTVTEGYDRISMHGVRVSLLQEQARALGFPLEMVPIPMLCTNAIYEERMGQALRRYLDAGIHKVICGDLFLEEVRQYREERLFGNGLEGVFPLWGRPTDEVARQVIAEGWQTVLCCVDTQALALEYAGRLYDEGLLADLPAEVDPCAERGEFHTFVFNGPLFSQAVEYRLGERLIREGRFGYVDLLPRNGREG